MKSIHSNVHSNEKYILKKTLTPPSSVSSLEPSGEINMKRNGETLTETAVS